MDLPQRVYFQYRSKPKSVAWFSISEQVGDELEACFGDIRDSYDIDSATGAQLDIIAAIVGADRSLLRGLILGTTQFALAANAADVQFGDSFAQFSAGTVSDDSGLSDQYLRLLIKWKIASNTGRATIEDILEAVHIVMPDLTAIVVDPEDMTFSLEFIGDGPSEVDALVMQTAGVVPTPQGVRYTGYTENGVFHSGN